MIPADTNKLSDSSKDCFFTSHICNLTAPLIVYGPLLCPCGIVFVQCCLPWGISENERTDAADYVCFNAALFPLLSCMITIHVRSSDEIKLEFQTVFPVFYDNIKQDTQEQANVYKFTSRSADVMAYTMWAVELTVAVSCLVVGARLILSSPTVEAVILNALSALFVLQVVEIYNACVMPLMLSVTICEIQPSLNITCAWRIMASLTCFQIPSATLTLIMYNTPFWE